MLPLSQLPSKVLKPFLRGKGHILCRSLSPSLLLLGEFGGGRRGVIRVGVGLGAKHLAVVVVAEMGWELSSLRGKVFSQNMLSVSA